MYSILFLVRVGDQRQHKELTLDDLALAQMVARRLCENPHRFMDVSIWRGETRLSF